MMTEKDKTTVAILSTLIVAVNVFFSITVVVMLLLCAWSEMMKRANAEDPYAATYAKIHTAF